MKRPELTHRALNANDLLLLLYLTVTALVGLFIDGALVVRHVGLAGLVLFLCSGGVRRGHWLRVLYSALLVPLLYLEVETLSRVAGGRVYDPQVLRWEEALFGNPTPALWWSQSWNYRWLSEGLHLCYLSYYLLIAWTAYRFYRCLSPADFQRHLCCLHLAWLAGFVVQIVFPVMGPRLLFPPLDPELHGPMWWLCHFLCGQGAAHAAAFPSGHASFACAVLLSAARWDRKALGILLPLCGGLMLATVYGRFHYLVDVVAGCGFATLAFLLGPALCRWVEGETERCGSAVPHDA